MAMAEDAASVLEQFVQDVANLPAEIAHLLEEIQAKDRIVQECRSNINSRDSCLQKFVKANGAGKPNPKEEAYAKSICSNFDKAQAAQEDKVSLSDKAAHLLDRQIKRLDMKIQDLQNDGAITIDPQLPSLLNTSILNGRLPTLTTGSSTSVPPLQPLSGNAGPSTTIARLAQPTQARQSSPLRTAALAPLPSNMPLSNLSTIGNPANPQQPSHLNSRLAPPRSPSTDSKRRRIATHLSIPPIPSNFRQSSLGPGTPKTQHPLAVSSRGSSVGPRPASKKPPRPPHHQRIGHLNPSSLAARAGDNSNKKLPGRRNPATKKASGTSTPGGVIAASGYLKPSPSEDTGDDSALSDADGQEEGSDADMEDAEGEGDNRKYCTCRSVSSGNMVACDNEQCPYEWFHWSCVGMTKEPAGLWYCEECRPKMR